MTDQTQNGVLLHIGCGEPDNLPSGGHIVLVEPNPACLPALNRLAAQDGARCQVISAAVAGEAGPAPFHLLTLEALSGLHGPEALSALMPGLRTVETIEVTRITIDSLLAEIGLQGDGHRLILEALGEEGAILTALAKADALARFAEITVLTTREPLYAGGPDAAQIAALLTRAGFRPCSDLPPEDPDLPVLAFRLDHTLRAVLETARRDSLRAAARQQELDHAVAHLTELHAAAVARADNLQASSQSRIAALETQLSDAQGTARRLADELASVHAELAAAHADIETGGAQRGEQAQIIAGLHEHVAVLERERDAAQANADREHAEAVSRAARIVDQDRRLAELMAAQGDLHQSATAAQAEVKRLQARIAQLEAALAQSREGRQGADAALADLEAKLAAITHAWREETTTLGAQIDMLTNAANAAGSRIKTLEATLAEQTTAAGSQIKALETTLAERTTAAGSRIKTLETTLAERTRRVADLEAGLTASRADTNRFKSEAAAVSRRLADAESVLETQRGEQARQRGEMQRLHDDLSQQRARVEAGRVRQTELEAALAAARQSVVDQSETVQRARQDMAVALRLQAMAGADLKDLQARYAEVLRQKDAQETLIGQLAQRLGEASDYLRQLSLNAPAPAAVPVAAALPPAAEPAADPAPQPVVEAVTGAISGPGAAPARKGRGKSASRKMVP